MSDERDWHDLARQAERHGVALRYHSFWGEDKEVAPAVLAQALASMGLREPPPPATGVPPVHVALQGEPVRIAWRGAPAGGRWQLAPEQPATAGYSGDVERDGDESVIVLPPSLATGYWQLTVEGDPAGPCLVVIAPHRCWAPAALLEGQRWWGCTIQLYALRSARNWGIGDFGDLRRLVDTAARQGASFVGLSPLHALFPHRPEVASPYSPSSRTALNPIYLDVQALAELSGCEEARRKLHSEEFQDRLRRLREADLVDYP
ncbi:MAG: 4-alpha-glucanotransferase, partial [Ramlibacter sp.]